MAHMDYQMAYPVSFFVFDVFALINHSVWFRIDCSLCMIDCTTCKSTPYKPAFVQGECGYKGDGYTRVHRDTTIVNAMRKWMGLGSINGNDIDLSGC
jgi:hypothetical protein